MIQKNKHNTNTKMTKSKLLPLFDQTVKSRQALTLTRAFQLFPLLLFFGPTILFIFSLSYLKHKIHKKKKVQRNLFEW